MIRVIVSTRNRPHFLAAALESIRTQANRNDISSVVVSENSDDSRSRDICEAFRELPIEYIHRQPPVPVLEHFRMLFLDNISEPYTAILHDDDWWAGDHLSESLAAIKDSPSLSACFSNFYETRGAQCPAEISEKAIRVWIATGADFSKPVLGMDVAGVIAANLLEATFHYSTLVARTPALQFAMTEMLKTNNPFDNDRVVPIFLAEKGNVVFRTKPSAWIRFHPHQDSERADYCRLTGSPISSRRRASIGTGITECLHRITSSGGP
jgi:glycosyltransferase involved in cell wall biosynthesis